MRPRVAGDDGKRRFNASGKKAEHAVTQRPNRKRPEPYRVL
jgi:hypothetical protein